MPYLGELSALLTAFLWSGTSFAFSSAAQRIGSFQLNVNRIVLACIFLLITILVMNFNYTVSSSQLINLSISGIIGLVIGDTFLFAAYRHIGPRLSMLLMALSPAMSAALAFFFLDESLNILAVLGMLITLSGVALVIFERKELPESKYKISRIGIFHGLMGAFGQAAGLVFAKLAFDQGEINGFVATFIRIASSVVIIVPLAFIIQKYSNPIKVYLNDRKALISTITGTVLGPYLGITFSLIAVSHTKVGIAATLMSTMPIIM